MEEEAVVLSYLPPENLIAAARRPASSRQGVNSRGLVLESRGVGARNRIPDKQAGLLLVGNPVARPKRLNGYHELPITI
jgi:hypothetical protein